MVSRRVTRAPDLSLWHPGRAASDSALESALQGLSLGDLWRSRSAPVRDPNTAALLRWADTPGSRSKQRNASELRAPGAEDGGRAH